MSQDRPDTKPGDDEQRWEIDPERSTAEEIVLRPARHPSRGHTRTMGEIVEFLREEADDESAPEEGGDADS